jgi:acyl carrier protein
MTQREIRAKLSAIVTRIAPLIPQTDSGQTQRLEVNECAIEMDSVAMLQLVLAVEEEFGVEVEDNDISPANFGDFAALNQYVAKKLQRS